MIGSAADVSINASDPLAPRTPTREERSSSRDGGPCLRGTGTGTGTGTGAGTGTGTGITETGVLTGGTDPTQGAEFNGTG